MLLRSASCLGVAVFATVSIFAQSGGKPSGSRTGQFGLGFDLEYGWPEHQSLSEHHESEQLLLTVQFFYRAKS
jgi:hypothetical protein